MQSTHGIAFALAMATIVLAPSEARAAEVVVLTQKHTKAEIDTACGRVNGAPVSGPNGEGYGCYNPANGVLVACSDDGECTGFIPRRTSSRPRDLTVLGGIGGGAGPILEVDPFGDREPDGPARPPVAATERPAAAPQ